MKKVFTTGQVAKICKVAPRTVSKWFDSGRLRGYRIPGSQDRRIPREHLLRFLKEHGMPLGDLEAEVYHKILVVGADAPMLGSLREQLREGDDFRIETAASGFEAGIRAHIPSRAASRPAGAWARGVPPGSGTLGRLVAAAAAQRPELDPCQGRGVQMGPGGAADLPGGDGGDPPGPGDRLVETQSVAL